MAKNKKKRSSVSTLQTRKHSFGVRAMSVFLAALMALGVVSGILLYVIDGIRTRRNNTTYNPDNYYIEPVDIDVDVTSPDVTETTPEAQSSDEESSVSTEIPDSDNISSESSPESIPEESSTAEAGSESEIPVDLSTESGD